MNDNNRFTLAATELLKHRVKGTKAPRLDIDIRPKNIDDALKIQTKMTEQSNDSIGGWKCALPFDDKIVVAPIFSNTKQSGSTCKLFKEGVSALIEPEIAFILNKDLPAQSADYSEDEINSAIGRCHMALELIQSRFVDNSGAEFPELLADLMYAQGLFIGPEIDRVKAFSASHVNLTITQGDNVKTFEGEHPNTLPQIPIYWFINYMSKRGVTFKKGEAIITGSYAGVVALNFDIETHIWYENIGEFNVTFVES